MANLEHVSILEAGKENWNSWMKNRYPGPTRIVANNSIEAKTIILQLIPDLSEYDFSNRDLSGYDFYRVNFSSSNLTYVKLVGANLRRCNLEKVDLSFADLSKANLSKSNMINAILDNAICVNTIFTEANMSKASLYKSNLEKATLFDTRLLYTRMIQTNLKESNITGCKIYGISVWDVEIEDAIQHNLSITKDAKDVITVDNLYVAQFIYLLLNNSKIRDIIDTITSKVVLILGRFTKERKAILDFIRKKLREKNYLPILFDFDAPQNRDITETISTIAHLSKFIIADITEARSIPQELQTIIPNLPSVPIMPILKKNEIEYVMLEHYKRYNWVLETCIYDEEETKLDEFINEIIVKCEYKLKNT